MCFGETRNDNPPTLQKIASQRWPTGRLPTVPGRIEIPRLTLWSNRWHLVTQLYTPLRGCWKGTLQDTRFSRYKRRSGSVR